MPFDVGPVKKHTRASVLLLRAAQVIEDPRNWSIGQWKRGHWWSPWTRKRYCGAGAVSRAAALYDLVEYKDVEGVLDRAAQAHGFVDMPALNDHPDTTHALVIQVLQEAAELAMTD